MPPELANQIQTGTPLNERECFEWATEGLRTAADSLRHFRMSPAIEALRKAQSGLRGASILRLDYKWQIVVRQLDDLIDHLTGELMKVARRPARLLLVADKLDAAVWVVAKMKDRGGPALAVLPHREPRR